MFPSSLEILKFDDDFNQILLPNIFPSKLKILQLNSKFNQPLNENIFPTLIEILQFGSNFNHPLNLINLRIFKFFCNNPCMNGGNI